MSSLQVVPVPAFGAEDVVLDEEGNAYTGTVGGSIFRISPDLQRIDLVVNTGGRPLGMELDRDGTLVVCDTDLGLLRVDPRTGATTTLATEAGGVPLLVCNNPAIGEDGTIWFTDSSSVHRLEHWRRDFGEDTRTGRLLKRDPDGTVHVLATGLRFANGVAVANDGSWVAVAESRGACVQRYWLEGEKAGRLEPWLDLIGYPDNIARGSDGLLWVAIGSLLDPLVDVIGRMPMPVRRAIMRLPQRLQPQPKGINAQAYDDDGTLVHDIDLDDDGFHMVTGVREHHGRLWLSSVEEAALAVLDL